MRTGGGEKRERGRRIRMVEVNQECIRWKRPTQHAFDACRGNYKHARIQVSQKEEEEHIQNQEREEREYQHKYKHAYEHRYQYEYDHRQESPQIIVQQEHDQNLEIMTPEKTEEDILCPPFDSDDKIFISKEILDICLSAGIALEELKQSYVEMYREEQDRRVAIDSVNTDCDSTVEYQVSQYCEIERRYLKHCSRQLKRRKTELRRLM